VELKQALTETMIDLAERRMVETHALVFASLVTFDSLINHEKMTDQELNELVHIGKVFVKFFTIFLLTIFCFCQEHGSGTSAYVTST